MVRTRSADRLQGRSARVARRARLAGARRQGPGWHLDDGFHHESAHGDVSERRAVCGKRIHRRRERGAQCTFASAAGTQDNGRENDDEHQNQGSRQASRGRRRMRTRDLHLLPRDSRRTIVDYDGLTLIRVTPKLSGRAPARSVAPENPSGDACGGDPPVRGPVEAGKQDSDVLHPECTVLPRTE